MIWYPYQQMKTMKPPYRIVNAEGVCLYTEERKLIDSVSSWWSVIHGYKHPVLAEAAKSVADHCGEKILDINVMNNLSVDCDCDAHPEDPKMGDIGLLASTDPVAQDKACVVLVSASPDPGTVNLNVCLELRPGIHPLEHGEPIGLVSKHYKPFTQA